MIGIYDSGVGGLAVLREVRAMLPNADLLFLADQANVPYGERPLEEVRELAEAALGLLVERGVTTAVVACNTASAAALGHVRMVFPEIAIVGMEPAVKPAAATTRAGIIGVLATSGTFAAAGFDELVGRHAEDAVVLAQPCPGWAASVEDGWPDGAEGPIAQHLAPLLAAGVDTLVLACTHYSFLAEVIGRIAGPGVVVVDPVNAVARQAVRVAGTAPGTGSTTYLTTGDPASLAAQVERLLGERVAADAAR